MLNYAYYMYNLRKSPLLCTFNTSPDETTYYRFMVLREAVMEGLTIIKPRLFEFSPDGQHSEEIPLCESSLTPNTTLLLDTYFIVLLYNPEGMSAGMNKSREKFEAQSIVCQRVHTPEYLWTQHDAPGTRHLLARLNPTSADGSSKPIKNGVVTLDTDVQSYLEHIKNQLKGSSFYKYFRFNWFF
ncbi:hypothetical protein Pcinc_034150 [Petrolisthes cinctipes]|uniref:Protein transport protein SEC23 n=1 Tax=Petrolisthes cinctipes TaxID=88211 RepID=A0AAE1EQX7_PETCI|nr:hypothetical protein Pcinc_034150 [Petrolisthes cinctipes]